MGYLAIRKVIYIGENYKFESPNLNDGIVILEGDNEHGKTTFMNLIYYGLGGKVPGFYQKDKKSTSKHTEIYNDKSNYVELHIEINKEKYSLIRAFNSNIISIIDRSKEKIIEASINRNGKSENTIFSDWILGKLGIEVFDIVQGVNQFKLGFNDLMRLIYYDQKTDIDKIYKSAQNENFISDSRDVRCAIFEVLIGESYNEYYNILGKQKLKSKEYDKVCASLDAFNEFLRETNYEKLENIEYIKGEIEKKIKNLELLNIERNLERTNINSSNYILNEIEENRKTLLVLIKEEDDLYKVQEDIQNLIDKIILLIEETNNEIREIEKIIFANKNLNLFSSNTCPYCLNEVVREKNKCLCGSDINDEEYEKFFYSSKEYLEILQLKNKSLKSLMSILNKREKKLKLNKIKIENLQEKIKQLKYNIMDLSKDIDSSYSSSIVREIDDKINSLNSEISLLEQSKQLALKKEVLVKKTEKIRNELEALKIDVKTKYNLAQRDISNKKIEFNKIYDRLMKKADKYCYRAYIDESYMPVVNEQAYRARSASVSKRLMYFLTLLKMSLEYDINYPRFLMIDTPNKEGIDIDNLKVILEQIEEINEHAEEKGEKFQVILTTGIGIYPEILKKYIALTLIDENKLLKKI